MTDDINRAAKTVHNHVQTIASRFNIPRPRSLTKFIIYPSLWRLPQFNNLPGLERRIKNNLLYFQTNYLIIALAFFALFMILSMRTLLTGIVSAAVIIIAILFFFEHIPQARQIKQNHPSVVIVVGIALVFIAWNALHTILVVLLAALAPTPLCLLHAATRSTENLIESGLDRNYFVSTPMGQIMQMIGIEPSATLHE